MQVNVRLCEWARQKPLSICQLMALHEAVGGPMVHVNTPTVALKKAQYVCKRRTRHSLKKRDPKWFKQAQEELTERRAQALAGEI